MTITWILKHPFKRKRPRHLASLYEVVLPSKGKENIIKVDRNILQKPITSYRGGCEVNLENILQHELMTVPLYLATTSGSPFYQQGRVSEHTDATSANPCYSISSINPAACSLMVKHSWWHLESRLTLEHLMTMPTALPVLYSRCRPVHPMKKLSVFWEPNSVFCTNFPY